jgi:transcriptional regulator with XRE-family HTH domain
MISTPEQAREALRTAMARAAMTQQSLAERSGVIQPSISRYLGGRKTITVDTYVRLLTATGSRLEVRRPRSPSRP